MCEVPLSEPEAVAFLGGALCCACCEQMNAELAEMREQEVEDRPGIVHATRLDAAPSSEPAVWTPGSETVTCAGCQRPMPGPGSYRVLGGASYCAGCLPFYARLDGEAGALLGKSSGTSDQLKSEPPTETHPGCDCCGRDLPANAAELSGFRFCAACQVGDWELALVVAKARHRRRLLKLKKRLEEGSDDHR